MNELGLTEAGRAVADYVFSWATSYEMIREMPGCRLFLVITPQDEEQYYTLLSEPQPCLIFHEPVSFVVTVRSAKGECRAGQSRRLLAL